MGSVPDAEETRSMPAPEAVDLELERLHVIPPGGLALSSVREGRHELGERPPECLDPLPPKRGVRALGDDVSDLPVLAAVDHGDDVTGQSRGSGRGSRGIA